MTKGLFIILMVCITTNVTGQGLVNKSALLLQSDQFILKCLDKEYPRFGNETRKIERKTADNGDLIILFNPDKGYTDHYNFYSIALRFMRIEGKEICISVNVMGDAKYGAEHLQYVKDKYIQKKEGTWVLDFGEGSFNVQATFEVTREEETFFHLDFTLVNK